MNNQEVARDFSLANKKVSVIGFGRSGKACAELLIKMGAKVFVSEINKSKTANYKPQTEIEFEFGGHTDRIYDASLIVVSPGISVTHPVILEAKKRNIPVLGELELASRFTNNRIVAVTGTNGKTTTASLIHKILESAQIPAILCGNIGVPLSSVVCHSARNHTDWMSEESNTVLVVEVSTFQLETIETFRPWIGVLLNISADHLDRHKNFDEYKDLKFRLFSNQKESDFAVLNFDDPNIKSHPAHKFMCETKGKSQKLYFSTQEPAQVWIKGKEIYYQTERLCNLQDLNLQWECLLQNYLASIVVGKIFKLPNEVIIKGLSEFKGVSHRLEFVGIVNGVKFINNSMCTNPAAFVSTLYSFKIPPVLIVGGKKKNVDITSMVDAINKKTKYAVLIGETSEELSKLLKIDYRIARSLTEAVELAYSRADEGDTVLLSPGFASFDWFRDFSDRGEKFKLAVKELKNRRVKELMV